MGIYNKNEIADYIENLNEPWDGKTGLAVEDLICREINAANISIDDLKEKQIKKATFENPKLSFFDTKDNFLFDVDVTPVPPSYEQSIVTYGLRVNGDNNNLYNTTPNQDVYIQYKNATLTDPATKIEAAIAIRSISTILEKTYDRVITVPVSLTISSEDGRINKVITRQVTSTKMIYFTPNGQNYTVTIPEEGSVNDLFWVDITELFTTKYNQAVKLTASFNYKDDQGNEATFSSTLDTKINIEFLDLQYTGKYIITDNSVKVNFKNSSQTTDSYQLIGFNVHDNISEKIQVNASGSINLVPGLNKIVVRAERKNDNRLASEWLKFDVICTTDFYGTAVAVNGISEKITNNGVATLYQLDVFSYEHEEFDLTTYLEDAPADTYNPKPKTIIKQERVQASAYDRTKHEITELTYQKYMEVINSGTTQYLYINVNGSFYNFISATYSNYTGQYSVVNSYTTAMTVEPCETQYTYVKDYNINLNYDQITGQVNNVFSTYSQKGNDSTLITNLLESDGWKERKGLTYLKLSKQDKNLLRNPINLNLGASFTIELGFKTYNVSDRYQSILNLGNFVLFPTQFGYLDGNSSVKSDAFLLTSAQFQEGQDTHLTITVQKNWKISKDDAYYPDYLQADQEAFDQGAPLFTSHLAKIYINGCIDREIILDDAKLNTLSNAALQINPKSSDIDLLLFRVYNTHALSDEEVIRNYISFIPDKTGILSKESVFNKNDILDESGKISWTNCLGKQNTLLFIYHTDSKGKKGRFPNRFWGQPDDQSDNDWNEKIPCTLVINYADPQRNLQYGGVLDKLQCKGQGSSAMRYLIWNVNSSLNKFKYETGELDENGDPKEKKAKSKFKPFGQIYRDQNVINLMPSESQQFNSVEGYYPMPTYDGEEDRTDYKYTKMVGKVNFASSMQSHKLGACKLYDDAYKAQYKIASLPSGGKKAVHEEPFMYFYIETDIQFEDNYESELSADRIQYDKILELGSQAKFMGFQTWGPGKGDDACSGYDEDTTPEYLMLEGGENKEPVVNFQRPWQTMQRLKTSFVRNGQAYTYSQDLDTKPTVDKSLSIEQPWAQLLIDDKSIVYTNRAAWDIDYGFVEDKVGNMKYYDFAEGAKTSLKVFRQFFDTAYLYDPTFITVSSLATEDTTTWSINKKYCILQSGTITLTYKDSSITSSKEYQNNSGDVYRFDEPSMSWVPAGLYYTNGSWETLNYSTLIRNTIGETYQPSSTNEIKSVLLKIFKNKMGGYVNQNNPALNEEGYLNIDDIAFHQAFIKFLSGTDNRAKNTYFQIIGKIYDSDGNKTERGDYKVRMIGDDLDTILATDNNGLQSKPYNLIEDSYYSEEDPQFAEVTKHWGDAGNLFFRSFDKSFEKEIRINLGHIMKKSALQPGAVNTKGGCYFYNQFFNVQESFPEIAYNHTAKIYYENAYVIKNCPAKYSFNFTNNNVDPISQSHGSCVQSEKQFVKERIQFLAGYAKSTYCLDNQLTTSSSGNSGAPLRLKMDFVPSQDFYPVYQYEEGTINRIGNDYDDSGYEILDCKAVEGQRYSKSVKEASTAINQMLFQTNLYKELTITGLTHPDLTADFGSLTSFTLDNDIIKQNPDLFEEDYPRLTISVFPKDLPAIEHLTLRNMVLEQKFDLSKYYKLKTLDLTGSSVVELILPQTNSLKSIILPESLEIFEVYNNPGLESVDYSGCTGLKTVYIDCSKCGKFNVQDFLENVNKSNLVSITIKNIDNLNITEEALMELLNNQCNLQGSITIVNSKTDLTPKNISFKTLKKLVEKFGNIRSTSNASTSLYVKFTPSLVSPTSFKYSEVVNAYYPGKETTYTDIVDVDFISGNNVAIVDGRLDITYTAVNFPSSVTLDSKTGAITVKQPESATDAKLQISVKTVDPVQTITNTSGTTVKTSVIFEWKAPKVGDFAYADGTFSNMYLSTKDLIGLVYKCDYNEASGKGTAYIIGKEYSNTQSHFLGPVEYTYTGDDPDSTPGNWAKLSNFIKFEGIADPHTIDHTSGAISYLNADLTIQPNTFSFDKYSAAMVNTTYTKDCKTIGQEDTRNYIEALHNSAYFNDVLRGTITSVNQNLFDEDQIHFKDTSSLNSACRALNESEITVVTGVNQSFTIKYSGEQTPYTSALLYPYFYSAYVYEPNVQNLDPQYRKNKWYAPSIYEMSLVLYYRLLSSKNAGQPAGVFAEIDDTKVSTDSDKTTPIFSLAKSKMKNSIPDAWISLGNRITAQGGAIVKDCGHTPVTTKTSPDRWNGENYSYIYATPYWTTYEHLGWLNGDINCDELVFNSGGQTNVMFGSGSEFGKSVTHKYEGFKGIPFTHYNFEKPI